ncbi:DNA adenine methylase [Dyadobacter diqingensis]|uniref:DNA adenine methylase n=1 Tax=Dyadobacter diqingensis TaxID=2938121 RepID=UPI0020C1BCAA|nr:DNA adenine methylase [Dyadobacter diqingensis]
MKESTSYFGGKSGSGTYQTIINQIPPHRLYVEGFAGMAGVFRKKLEAKENLLIDRDRTVIHRLINAGVSPTHLYEGSFFQVANDFINDLDREDVFIYLDPPYPLDSRKSGTKYKFEITAYEHCHLLKLICTEFKMAKIAISTYPNEVYKAWLEEHSWRMIEFESKTRAGMATEQLWMNYPEPAELHDYQYLGEDYRERERITRKLKRWEAKFEDLSALEKQAMLVRLTAKLKNVPIGPVKIDHVPITKTVEQPIPKSTRVDVSGAVAMFESGMNLTQIAEHYGLRYNRLSAELRRSGLWMNIAKLMTKQKHNGINSQ